MFFEIGKVYAGVGYSGNYGLNGTSVSMDLSEDLYEGVYKMKKDVENVIKTYPAWKYKFNRVCDPRKKGSVLEDAEILAFKDVHGSEPLDAILKIIVKNEGGSQSFGLRNGMIDYGNFVLLSKSKLVEDDDFSTNVTYDNYYVYIFGTATGGITGFNLPGVKSVEFNDAFKEAILSKKSVNVRKIKGVPISKYGLTDILYSLRKADLDIPIGNSLMDGIYLINLGRASGYNLQQLGCVSGLFNMNSGEFSIDPNRGYCVHSIRVHDYLKFLFSKLKANIDIISSVGIVDPIIIQYLLDVSWHRGSSALESWSKMLLPYQGKIHSSRDFKQFADVVHLKKYEYRLGAYVYA